MTATAVPSPAPGRSAGLWLALAAIGFAWGATSPLTKLAVTSGHHPVGVAFWNALIGALALSAAQLARRRPLPADRAHLRFFLICGLLGTALPHSLSFTALKHLPIGIVSILISTVPMMTLLIAVPLGIERADARRAAGLSLGLAAMLMIALPETSLPDPAQAAWLALPVIVALAYAAESVYIAAARPPGCDALTALWGLSWCAVALLLPPMLAMGAWVDISAMAAPERAILAMALLHLGAYSGFVWLIGRAGPVFSAQVGYVVTGSGVALGMLLYGERPSPWVWGALALMFAGMALVRPKRQGQTPA